MARGLCATRARAADAIRRGTVTVGGERVAKPGQRVSADADIRIEDPAAGYVSRAALKLLAALEAFPMDVGGRVCVDIGASTGGFTQVLLERGAARVFAVDVGHGQLDPSLRKDPRVVRLEGVNARNLTEAQVPEPPDVIVSDVSFISLTLALPPVLALARPGAQLRALVKPQFEAGPEHVGKGGIVRDERVHRRVLDRIRKWLEDEGWKVAGIIPSPVTGGDGNREFLVAAVKREERPPVHRTRATGIH